MNESSRKALARALLATGVKHPSGRDVFIDPEGYPETEKSMTLQDPRINDGAWTNLPTVWGGYQMTDPQWAANNALVSGQSFPSYPTEQDAERAAIAKSRGLGQQMPHIPGMDYNAGRLTPQQMLRMWQRGY